MLQILDLFVWDAVSGEKVPVIVNAVTKQNLTVTMDWQTSWENVFMHGLPNKVALRRTDDGELLGQMSYKLDEKGLNDPFGMIIWEDAAERIIAEFGRDSNV